MGVLLQHFTTQVVLIITVKFPKRLCQLQQCITVLLVDQSCDSYRCKFDPAIFLGQKDSLGRGMATHPSILAWRIPCTEETGRLQSTGSKESDTTE